MICKRQTIELLGNYFNSSNRANIKRDAVKHLGEIGDEKILKHLL